MKIAIVGTGYVGLVTGTCLAETGNHVTCVDCDGAKIDRLRRGEIPIFEPGLEEMVRRNAADGRLRFTTDLAAATANATLVFLAVGTPPADDGSVDLAALWAVVDEVAPHLTPDAIVVLKSTVPVGTNAAVTARLKALTGRDCQVASNPEFLKEGAAIDDFMKPDRVVVGTRSDRVFETLLDLYQPYLRTDKPLLAMSPESAEMTKYAANALLSTKISFINEVANICERCGADINEVRRGIGHDSRIGFAFLFPGVGYGGSCFPKDVRALAAVARQHGVEPRVLEAVHEVNRRQKTMLLERIAEHFGGQLRDKTIAVWGLAFKPATDDIREAPALALIDGLLGPGRDVAGPRPRGDGERPPAVRRPARLLRAAGRGPPRGRRLGDHDRVEALRTPGLPGDAAADAAAGDLRRPQPLQPATDQGRRLPLLQHRPADGVAPLEKLMQQPTLDEPAAADTGESWCDAPATLADGSTMELGPLSQRQLIELQWQQEREFARQILSAEKGSPARAAAVRRAYDTVAQIIAVAWDFAGKPMALGYDARLGQLVLRILRRQQRRAASPRFFEIGYANGLLLKFVGDAGFGVAGIEVSAKLRGEACRLLGAECQSRLHLGDFLRYELPASQRPIDVVYWNDVFEHIPPDEIGDYLRRIYDLLSPGGQLITVTPNWHMRPADVTKGVCPPRTEAAGLHLKEYTLGEVTRLLRAAGFDRVATPLCVTRRRIVLCGRGCATGKRLFEPALEAMPFRWARLLCRGLGLSTTIATKR